MEKARVNGAELEYEVIGSGEPVLLISHILADCMVPLVTEPALADRYQLIRYHRRGWAGSTHTPPPVTIADHAADAAALLAHLDIGGAHVVGASSGADIAAQLALDVPDAVHTLALLELTMFSVPSGQAFLEQASPVLEAYGAGDHEAALRMFLSAVSGMDWPVCEAVLDKNVSGAVVQALKDADTLFGIELPSVIDWSFSAEQAAAIHQPVLSVVGANTGGLWVEIAEFLRSSLPDVEERTIDGVGHFLQIEQAERVAAVLATFLARHPMAS